MSDAVDHVMHRALEAAIDRRYENVALAVSLLNDSERQRLLWAANAVGEACRQQGADSSPVQARYRNPEQSSAMRYAATLEG